MIISYSELFKWDTCPRQYYYSFILGLMPVDTNVYMDTGTKGHKLLQTYYTALKEGYSKEHALEATKVNAALLLKQTSITEQGSLLKAWTLVDNYIKKTTITYEVELVENRFLIPMNAIIGDNYGKSLPFEFDGVQIGFTPDVVFKRPGGFLDVEDSKFVGKAWSKSKLNRFQQAKLYQIFLKRMGYNVSRSSVKFFNTTTGVISEKHDPLTPQAEAILVADFVGAVSDLLEYKCSGAREFARRTMNYTACQFCAFEDPCTLEAEGKDASKTLKHQFKKSDYDYSS